MSSPPEPLPISDLEQEMVEELSPDQLIEDNRYPRPSSRGGMAPGSTHPADPGHSFIGIYLLGAGAIALTFVVVIGLIVWRESDKSRKSVAHNSSSETQNSTDSKTNNRGPWASQDDAAGNTPQQTTPSTTTPSGPKPKVSLPQPEPKNNPAGLPAGQRVYQQLLRSTAFILTREAEDAFGRSFRGAGSGVLVDKDRKLVLTNYHVVKELRSVIVFFPQRDEQNKLITLPRRYVENIADYGTTGRVVDRNPTKDLALIELDRVPNDVTALPLARKEADIGSHIHSVGASGIELFDFSGALWRYSTGIVRARYDKEIPFKDGQRIQATFLETQSPVNSGDSGGPTVNDRGQLVGVVSAVARKQTLVSYSIDLSEVRAYLRLYAHRNGWQWPDPPPDDPETSPEPVNPNALDVLLTALREGSPTDRVTAARRIGDLGPSARAALPALLTALENAPQELADTISLALARIGPPLEGSEWILNRALSSSSSVARLYAATSFAKTSSIPAEAIPPLVACCDDKTPAIRVAALRALAAAGPKAKPAALVTVLRNISDNDLDVRDAARAALEKFKPFTEDDRPALVKSLELPDEALRAQVAEWLLPMVKEPREATAWYGPFLKSPSPKLRLMGIRGLSRAPDAFKMAASDVLNLCNDPDPEVVIEMLKNLPHIRSLPGVSSRVAEVFQKRKEAEVRQAAAAAYIQVVEARLDQLPAIRELYASGNTETKIVCIDRYQQLAPITNDVEKDLFDATADPDQAVRVAAFKAIATNEPLARKAIGLASRVFKRSDETDAVRAAAVGVLGMAGPFGFETLSKEVLTNNYSPLVNLAIVKALVDSGPKALTVQSWLFRRADEDADCRELIAELFKKHADTDTIKELIQRTEFYLVPKPGERKALPRDPAIRKWAVQLLGDLNYQVLPTDAVKYRLKTLASRIEDKDVQLLAEQALRKVLLQ